MAEKAKILEEKAKKIQAKPAAKKLKQQSATQIAKKAGEGKLAVAVRIRGTKGVRSTVSRTLEMLGLTRKNHVVLVKATPAINGMLNKAKDYLSWGEANADTVAKLIEKSARVSGNKPLSDKYVSENSGFKTVKEFSKAVAEGVADMAVVPGVKKVFRLQAPAKGYTTTKSLYPAGALGYRGDKINELIQKMIR